MNKRHYIVEVDLSTITSSAGLHERLAVALEVPSYYGRNWNAFWDLITEDAALLAPLRLIGWDALQQHLSRDAVQLRQCLDDLRTQFPANACNVIYD